MSFQMTGKICSEEIRAKVPSFQKAALFFKIDIQYSSDTLSMYSLISISLKLLITAVV